nr:PREDICTED: uncharacterized protein LOC109038664 isoform X1 [Bemisia tabaci]
MSFCKLNTQKSPSVLEQLIEEINFQRVKEMRQVVKDDSGFVMLQGSSYWTDLFVRHFLFQAEHSIDCDDLLFFVRKRHVKGSSRFLPKFHTEVDVFRKDSRRLPVGDPDIDWEETVYLNLIIHQFDYTLTLAVCTRTSPKELQVLKRHSQKVFASPSRRKMDTKGENEEMTYPYVCFMVDNFNEVFCDIFVRDGEMVCVELVASDHEGSVQSVIFLGSIRYDALKKVYDARMSLSSKMAQRMTFGLFTGSSQRVEFVRMKGPEGKGHAEMAVTKPKGCTAETPTSEPGYSITDGWDSDWEDDAENYHSYRYQRRLSDPSANLDTFMRASWRPKENSAGARARSENEGLDSLASGLAEIEAGDVRDDLSADFNLKRSKSAPSCHYPNSQSLDSMLESTAELISPKPSPISNVSRRSCALNRSNLSTELSLKNSEDQRDCVKDSHSNRNPTNSAAEDGSSESEEFYDCETWDQDLAEILCDLAPVENTSYGCDLNAVRSSSDCDMYKKSGKTSSCDVEPHSSTHQNFSYAKKSGFVTVNRSASKQPPKKISSDGTVVSFWCDVPPQDRVNRTKSLELDDGAYNPLWTMRGFTQSFHFWKENKRAQSVPLNVFLTYVTLPWWSIVNDILDHREGPILTF